ncbi:hypothetical protein P8452_04408 [Trifolium repens]|nr:hypothetical protein P8452_04408 [Trifolium repens]
MHCVAAGVAVAAHFTFLRRINKNIGVHHLLLQLLHHLLSLLDADLVWEFISKDMMNQRLLNNNSLSDFTTGLAYTRLADLLHLIKEEKMLGILDKWGSEVMYIVNDLRQYSFEGMWLDSIEKLFANNLHNDAESLLKLETSQEQLREEQKIVNETLTSLTSELKKTNNNHIPFSNHICIWMSEAQKKKW